MYVISENVLITAVITSTFGHHHVSSQGGSNEVTKTKVNTNRKVIVTKYKNITSFIFLFEEIYEMLKS